MLALLGDIELDISSIAGIERAGTVTWAQHELINGKPLPEWIGDGLDEITLTAKLHSAFNDPDERLEKLRTAKSDHQPLAFVMGSGDYLGPYVIDSIRATTLRTDGNGRTHSADVQIILLEYTGPFERPLATPGLLDGAQNLTAPLSKSLPAVTPTLTQQAIAHARAAGNVLSAGMELYRAARDGSALNALSAVPRLIGVAGQAIEPLTGLSVSSERLEGGIELATAAIKAVTETRNAINTLTPVSIETVLGQVGTATEHIERAVDQLDGVQDRLLDLTIDVITRRADVSDSHHD